MNRRMTLYSKQQNYVNIWVLYDILSAKIFTYWWYTNKKKIKAQYVREMRVQKRMMHDLKINGCAICGYDKCNTALDFHHTNPEDRDFSLCIGGLTRTNKRIVEELNKCILLCKNCHYEIHDKARRNKSA